MSRSSMRENLQPARLTGPLWTRRWSVGCCTCSGRSGSAAPRGAGCGNEPTRALIAYLIVKRGPASLDELLEALWPEEPTGLTRARVWKAKQKAASIFGDALQRHHDCYQLDRGGQIQLDIDEIERLLRGQPGPARLEQALRLMQGEPLADIDYPWAENERRHLQGLRTETLTQAAQRPPRPRRPGRRPQRRRTADRARPPQRTRLAACDGSRSSTRPATSDPRPLRATAPASSTTRLGLRPSAETRDTYHRLLSQDRQIGQAEPGLREPNAGAIPRRRCSVSAPKAPSPANPKARRTRRDNPLTGSPIVSSRNRPRDPQRHRRHARGPGSSACSMARAIRSIVPASCSIRSAGLSGLHPAR